MTHHQDLTQLITSNSEILLIWLLGKYSHFVFSRFLPNSYKSLLSVLPHILFSNYWNTSGSSSCIILLFCLLSLTRWFYPVTWFRHLYVDDSQIYLESELMPHSYFQQLNLHHHLGVKQASQSIQSSSWQSPQILYSHSLPYLSEWQLHLFSCSRQKP